MIRSANSVLNNLTLPSAYKTQTLTQVLAFPFTTENQATSDYIILLYYYTHSHTTY